MRSNIRRRSARQGTFASSEANSWSEPVIQLGWSSTQAPCARNVRSVPVVIGEISTFVPLSKREG
jgi:hypothetical protein